ncbi:glycosyl hydrolase family 8 [Mesobacterium pallidum]|uniref:glycosyl hydrolase family 8 n=1 Tax=Mesobacterium pallidum TaxID=2872037 RepID=UPI001EE27363|nr:glycosyl hydrolase family 8 [Mesobacterium pallidum]
MIRRRPFLVGLGAALNIGAGPLGAAETADWHRWKTAFLRDDGRVTDALQGDASHSEGQGYGLLLAQAHGDKAAFQAMEHWAEQSLAIRQDSLMAWRWRPEDGIPDWHNATDGDLFRAWALMRADRFSGWSGADGTGYGAKARHIAADIAALCLAPDPRAPDEPLLTPSAESARGTDGVLFNPSYVMPRALRELGLFAALPRLVQAADHGETVLAELARRGPVPDWTRITPAGFSAPERHSSDHGYDAMRVALYLLWSDRRAHPAVARAARLYRDAGLPVPTVLSAGGEIRDRSTYAGYAELRALVLCRAQLTGGPDRSPYYPATLGLMAQVARRESRSCSN